MKKFSINTWWALTVGFGFASMISFFQINSAWADAHKFNGIFGWTGLGIIFGLIAIYSMYQVSKAGSPKD